MNRDTVDWKGYIPAITTPFLKNGEIDWEGWEELLHWLVDEGMHGVLVNGTTGEWFSQTVDEQKELFRAASTHVNKRIPVIVGCTSYTSEQVVDLAQAASDAEVSGILVAPPPYVVPNEEEVFMYYKEISDQVDLPICIYNWPRGTNVDLSVELISRLAKLDKVVAVKNSTPDFGHFIKAFYAVKDEIRYFGFPMNEIGYEYVKNLGGDGTMGAGAILGRVHPDFYNYLWAGNKEEALNNGRKDAFLFSQFFNSDFSAKFGSPQSLTKAALNLKGAPGGYPRKPILPLTLTETDRVQSILDEVEDL